jgi:exo-1,4-beta-D-glucosaminidase
MEKTARGREVRVELENPSAALAFQVNAAVRTQAGGLIAPVIWSDNWIELVPGEKRVLTALLPDGFADGAKVEIASWNAGALDVTPTVVSASARR